MRERTGSHFAEQRGVSRIEDYKINSDLLDESLVTSVTDIAPLSRQDSKARLQPRRNKIYSFARVDVIVRVHPRHKQVFLQHCVGELSLAF